jgi:hypothetical protein
MTIRIRLEPNRVDGIDCDRPVVTLRVLTRFGDYIDVPFLVDSGADLPSMSIRQARELGIPFERLNAGSVGGLVGRVSRFRGVIRVVLAGRAHTWPCYFLETPADADSVAMAVLGRGGFSKDYDVCTDDKFVTIRRRTRFRRWLSRLTNYLLRPFISRRESHEPL